MAQAAPLPLKHVFVPATQRAADGALPPLLVLLHGTGADEVREHPAQPCASAR
jgi:predicted esterase